MKGGDVPWRLNNWMSSEVEQSLKNTAPFAICLLVRSTPVCLFILCYNINRNLLKSRKFESFAENVLLTKLTQVTFFTDADLLCWLAILATADKSLLTLSSSGH